MLSLEQGSSMGAGGDRAGLFGDLLRRSRLSSGLTQEELGRRAGRASVRWTCPRCTCWACFQKTIVS